MICVEPPALRSREPQNVARLALQTSRTWTDRRELHVRYLGGTEDQRRYVSRLMASSASWSAVCGMLIVCDDADNAEIRVSFEAGPSWSQLGTDALWQPRDNATMNLALHETGFGREEQRTVLHEFGHALGFVHEQLSPLAGELNEEVARAFYVGVCGWSEAQFQSQVVKGRDFADLEAIAFDEFSVMAYRMGAEMWNTGPALVSGYQPSAWDAFAASTWYGPPARPWYRALLPLAARSGS